MPCLAELLSQGDNLHEISKRMLWKNKQYISSLSAVFVHRMVMVLGKHYAQLFQIEMSVRFQGVVIFRI